MSNKIFSYVMLKRTRKVYKSKKTRKNRKPRKSKEVSGCQRW